MDLMERCENLYNFEKPSMTECDNISKTVKPLVVHLFERSENPPTGKKSKSKATQIAMAMKTVCANCRTDDGLKDSIEN